MDIMAETLKALTLHSTINDSTNYNSDEDDAESDPKRDPLVDTHTSDEKKRKVTDTGTNNVNYPQKILLNRTIPVIILPIEPPITHGVEASRGTAHVRQTIYLKVIVTDMVRSGTHIFQDPVAVNQEYTDRTIPRGRNDSRRSPG